MKMLGSLVETVGLDYSFFYHLIFSVIIFFLSKKWLWQAYIQAMDKRTQLTKGRVNETEALDQKIQINKEIYEKKAKHIHKEFQNIFNDMKEDSLKYFSKESLKIQEEHKKLMKQKRDFLKKKVQEQEDILRKSLVSLSELLLEKIKS
ncbi:MAG: hypothetical protein GDA46_01430 [Bdellovibrionales bacterium]|nr:hypothetical protein [Bdellovibrionales bacterium]